MRIVVVFLLLGVVQPVLAITKCTLNGKVTYKRGACPKNATSKYLVKDEFVEESQLQEKQQERITQSEIDFKRMNVPSKKPDISDEWLESEGMPVKPKKMRMSNESAHFQLQKVDKQNDAVDKIKVPDGVNDKLSEMQRKLEQRNKELQQLQKK